MKPKLEKLNLADLGIRANSLEADLARKINEIVDFLNKPNEKDTKTKIKKDINERINEKPVHEEFGTHPVASMPQHQDAEPQVGDISTEGVTENGEEKIQQ